jgi:hypothetical protein
MIEVGAGVAATPFSGNCASGGQKPGFRDFDCTGQVKRRVPRYECKHTVVQLRCFRREALPCSEVHKWCISSSLCRSDFR